MPDHGAREPFALAPGLASAPVGAEILAGPGTLFRTLMATGADAVEALRMIRQGFPVETLENDPDIISCIAEWFRQLAPQPIRFDHSGFADQYRNLRWVWDGRPESDLPNKAVRACKGMVLAGHYLGLPFDVKAIPDELHVKGNLLVSSDDSVCDLPPGLSASGDGDITECRKLMRLPDGLKVGGNLRINRCRSLETLPEGLRVGGNLALGPGLLLKHLPKGLWVGRNLILRGYDCPDWDGIVPEDAEIGGLIYTAPRTRNSPSEVQIERELGGLTLAQWREHFGTGSCFDHELLQKPKTDWRTEVF